jgi:hypothetical protein
VKRIIGIAFVALLISAPSVAGADELGTQVPSNCVAHTSFDNDVDLRDDYRCAGLAIEFHTAGVAFSPGPIWAGQWLFVDENNQFRVGSCTFNRGIHPTIDAPSAIVVQQFPNDPTGAKGAYLTWRYGDTTDNLTAAAMWAVFHYYAQDSAGTRRSSNGLLPLVPTLDMVARASGRDDIQSLAIALDAEAAQFEGDWALEVTLDVDGSINVVLVAGGQPVADQLVTLLVSGQDAPLTIHTDAAGAAQATMPVTTGTMTVVATTAAPGLAVVYRGTPAGPDPHGAQRLVTAGAPRVLSATATVDMPIPPTSTTSTTSTTTTTPTTTPPTTSTTTVPSTTTSTSTTLPATTSTTSTTVVPTTIETTVPSTEPEVVPVVESLPPPPLPSPPAPLPRTGKGPDLISYLATALVVAGIGIVGVAGRRPPRGVIYTRWHDAGGGP